MQLRAFELVLARLAAGHEPLPASAVRARPDGRVAVRTFPATRLDRLIWLGYHAEVWMPPGTSAGQVRAAAARAYRGAGFDHPGVAVVLGAGNFACTPAMDAIGMLYREGCVVVLKMNPVNDYLRPFFERVFADYVDRGWLRFVDGGADVGGYLAHHPGVDRVHMTGSADTYNALVWGTGDDAGRRRAAGTPRIATPFTAELGGVNPIVVAPGPWTASDIRRQAGRIVQAKLFNCGHTCAAVQVLVVPDSWVQADALLQAIRELMRSLEPRQPYYPGTHTKVSRAVAGGPRVEPLQPPDRRILVTGLAPGDRSTLFTDEVFADVLGVVRLPAQNTEAYLAEATRFANEELSGTLAASLFVHPQTAKHHPDAVERTVADLRYGTIAVNEWAGLGGGMATGTWGGYPGHTPQDIGSGVGVVNNAFQLRDPEKTVITGLFHPLLTPVTSATHRTLPTLLERLTGLLTTDDLRRLPGVLSAAARG